MYTKYQTRLLTALALGNSRVCRLSLCISDAFVAGERSSATYSE